MKRLGEKLEKLITKEKITPEILHQRLPNDKKIASTTIRNYLKGTPPKSLEQLFILAEFFNVPVEYLYDDSSDNLEKENIDIGKELGLSDDAINFLKIYKNKNLSKWLNLFFTNNNFPKFMKLIYAIEEYEDAINKNKLADKEILEMQTQLEELQQNYKNNTINKSAYTKKFIQLDHKIKELNDSSLKDIKSKFKMNNDNFCTALTPKQNLRICTEEIKDILFDLLHSCFNETN